MNKKKEPLDPDVQEVVHLNGQLELVHKSVLGYVDERLQNLDPKLLAEAAPGEERPRRGSVGSSLREWRFDVYFLLALLLLAFIAWKVWDVPPARDGAAAPVGKAQVQAPQAGKVPPAVAQEPWARLAVLAGRLAGYRADFYFLVLSLLLGSMLWRLHGLRKEVRQVQIRGLEQDFLPVPETPRPSMTSPPQPAPAPELPRDQSWGWWPLGRRWHLRRWQKFALRNQQKVLDWLDRLTKAEGLPPGAIAKGLDDVALIWRSVVDRGRPLGERDAERSVRALFQYQYARWAAEKAANEKGRKRESLRVTGQTGVVPQEVIPELVEMTFLDPRDARRYKSLMADDPKLQVAFVIQRIEKFVP